MGQVGVDDGGPFSNTGVARHTCPPRLCMGYMATHTTSDRRCVLPLCIEGRNSIGSYTYYRKHPSSQPSPSIMYEFNGAAAGDALGSAVAVAGVTGDGVLPHVIIGADHANSGRGAVQIFDGRDFQRVGLPIEGQPGDFFGARLALSDVNSDGTRYLVVGAWG